MPDSPSAGRKKLNGLDHTINLRGFCGYMVSIDRVRRPDVKALTEVFSLLAYVQKQLKLRSSRSKNCELKTL